MIPPNFLLSFWIKPLSLIRHNNNTERCRSSSLAVHWDRLEIKELTFYKGRPLDHEKNIGWGCTMVWWSFPDKEGGAVEFKTFLYVECVLLFGRRTQFQSHEDHGVSSRMACQASLRAPAPVWRSTQYRRDAMSRVGTRRPKTAIWLRQNALEYDGIQLREIHSAFWECGTVLEFMQLHWKTILRREVCQGQLWFKNNIFDLVKGPSVYMINSVCVAKDVLKSMLWCVVWCCYDACCCDFIENLFIFNRKIWEWTARSTRHVFVLLVVRKPQKTRLRHARFPGTNLAHAERRCDAFQNQPFTQLRIAGPAQKLSKGLGDIEINFDIGLCSRVIFFYNLLFQNIRKNRQYFFKGEKRKAK